MSAHHNRAPSPDLDDDNNHDRNHNPFLNPQVLASASRGGHSNPNPNPNPNPVPNLHKELVILGFETIGWGRVSGVIPHTLHHSSLSPHPLVLQHIWRSILRYIYTVIHVVYIYIAAYMVQYGMRWEGFMACVGRGVA